jgi:multiple inositol-polyphosphate phosphatase / 2,3-bisphosphoglycerate 3-phosphatase
MFQPYQQCEVWKQSVGEQTHPEVTKFQNSDTYQNVVAQISQRLGFKNPLSADQIDLIWDLCRLEQAWFLEKPSPWCAVSSVIDL